MKRSLVTCIATLATWCVANVAQAQTTWPSERPIGLVVPFAPGGGTDILARLVAQKLGEQMGQTIVVDNKPGANGALALQAVERAKSDGYTLMFGSSSTHVLAPLMSDDKKAMEGVRKKSVMVSIVAETPLVLAVSARSEISTLSQLRQVARTKSLTYGTFGTGSSPHVLGELLAARTGTQLLHVAYKGSSPAITDLRGGHIDSVFLTVAALSAQVESKEIRPLAVTGARRVQSLPDVPTFTEAGITGLGDSGWFAVFAPAGTPVAVLERLHAGVTKVMTLPQVQAKLVELGLQRAPGNREEDAAAWDRSIIQTHKILRQIKITSK
ncbi:Bug family tripartite tricarboxylate transporter substrate binding protein [Variovorax sp. GB1P17]|uniref:Bug family tripartite tricarboxylate transporter substrate binding protein n=1 Tax=Variovorax sp. GB1P17 TaxID=3443740 RepID=UPI003F44679A